MQTTTIPTYIAERGLSDRERPFIHDIYAYAPVSDGFTDQRDEDEADQEYCERVALRGGDYA